MVRQGLFREDLYFRLRTIALAIPPLRERTSDVDLLVAHFLGALNERFGVRKRMGPDALARLRRHDWPGNVRELHHVVEGTVRARGESAAAGPRCVRAAGGAQAYAGGSARRPSMTRLELTDEEAVILRDLLDARWQELLKEIRHTDHREFRELLKARAATLERLVSQLSMAEAPAR
jgi:DNA-binding NtrC family response regulator